MAEVPSYFQRTRVNERVEAIIELSLHTYGLKVHVRETSLPLQQQRIRLERASALMSRTDGVDGRIAWNDALAFHSISILAFKPFHWLLRENIGTKKVCSEEELGPSPFVCSTSFSHLRSRFHARVHGSRSFLPLLHGWFLLSILPLLDGWFLCLHPSLLHPFVGPVGFGSMSRFHCSHWHWFHPLVSIAVAIASIVVVGSHWDCYHHRGVGCFHGSRRGVGCFHGGGGGCFHGSHWNSFYICGVASMVVVVGSIPWVGFHTCGWVGLGGLRRFNFEDRQEDEGCRRPCACGTQGVASPRARWTPPSPCEGNGAETDTEATRRMRRVRNKQGWKRHAAHKPEDSRRRRT